MIATLFKLLGCIALLIYGMKVMSEALQKMAGPQLRHILGAMTTNRFTGVLTGMTVAVAVQSSAATTVMTVSFVNAGLLTLAQAISVIMGANIGTTLSAWIMSAGFSFNITMLVWPTFLVGIILINMKKRRYIGDFLFGLSFMFFALGTLNLTGREMDLAHNEGVVNFFAGFDSGSYLTILLFLLIGAILTAIAQSSAALMAITMVLCSSGVLTIYQGIALVMGENIGTTVTANLAAMSGNTQARRAALAHLVFNIFGVCWILCLFYPFVNLACRLVSVDPEGPLDPTRISFVLAAFHTLFNVTNTFILIWFIPQIEKIVCKIIPVKEKVDEESRLQYIQSGIMKTPEISVLQAQKEIEVFGDRMQRMFGMVRELFDAKDGQEAIFERIEKYEGISDNMENEIGLYLGKVSDAHLSDETKGKIRSMLREISELESIGDSCYNLARAMKRKSEPFTDTQNEGVRSMFGFIEQALERMNAILKDRKEGARASDYIEAEINDTRLRLREQNSTDVDNHAYSFASGTIYMDIVNECEKCGDYVMNVVEARLDIPKNQLIP